MTDSISWTAWRGGFLAATAAVVACTAVRTEPTAVPNTDFDLRIGGIARVQDTDIRIRFDTVPDDSRCPADVQCVWAGNATVRLTVDSSGKAALVDLKTSVAQPGSAFGTRIELRRLGPYPTASQQPRQSDYVATLRVSSP